MNDLINCFPVIHMPQMQEITVDACATARATIRAAEIQAKAARSAGTETVFAGLLAFVASILAVIIAYLSASRDSKRLEKERDIINKAYITALHALVYSVLIEVEGLYKFLGRLSYDGKLINANGRLVLPDILDLRFHRALRDALALERSSDLSKLPNNAIKHAVSASIAVDSNLIIYSSIESFLPRENNNTNSMDFSEINYRICKSMIDVFENEKYIKELYEILSYSVR